MLAQLAKNNPLGVIVLTAGVVGLVTGIIMEVTLRSKYAGQPKEHYLGVSFSALGLSLLLFGAIDFYHQWLLTPPRTSVSAANWVLARASNRPFGDMKALMDQVVQVFPPSFPAWWAAIAFGGCALCLGGTYFARRNPVAGVAMLLASDIMGMAGLHATQLRSPELGWTKDAAVAGILLALALIALGYIVAALRVPEEGSQSYTDLQAHLAARRTRPPEGQLRRAAHPRTTLLRHTRLYRRERKHSLAISSCLVAGNG